MVQGAGVQSWGGTREPQDRERLEVGDAQGPADLPEDQSEAYPEEMSAWWVVWFWSWSARTACLENHIFGSDRLTPSLVVMNSR